MLVQVTAVKTSKEALQHLVLGTMENADTRGPEFAAQGDSQHLVDLVIKEHEPPAADAGRLLKRMARSELLRRIPVVGTCISLQFGVWCSNNGEDTFNLGGRRA